MLGSDIERNVNAAFFQITGNVLPEVGKLKRGAGRVRQTLAFAIAVATKIKDEPADWIRGIEAVTDHLVPGLIALGRLILTESLQ